MAAKLKKPKNERGFAIMETLVFMMGFVILAAYCIDFFTIVHTGVVNSIASRTYLFETLQHRSNIRHLRQIDELGLQSQKEFDFLSMHFRFHSVQDEGQDETSLADGAKATGRTISLASDANPERSMNDTKIDSQSNKTTTVWLKTGYGICIDADCPGGTP